jgi:YQGE family putative transporter
MKLDNEIKYFKSFPRNMRYLLFASLLYAFVLPVIELFVGSYIVSPPDPKTVLSIAEKHEKINLYLYYQFALYTGIPICFVLNGFLLRKIKITYLYSLGLLLSGISMTLMMSLKNIDTTGVIFAGLIMGASYGFFWANRDFMSLEVTNDENRNYYFSIDTIFYTITWIIVPASVGYILTYGPANNLYTTKSAYIVITIVVFIITGLATIIINSENFNNPKSQRLIFFKFDRLWNKMILFSITKGVMQGAIMIFPILLILSIIGGVNMLGIIVSGGQVVSAVMLYLIGRYASPKHRLLIYIISISFFTVAILVHGTLYSVLGVIIYNILQFIAKPLHDVSYFPTEFRVIDIVSKKENRNEFSYIINHEFTLFVGRVSAILIVLFLAYKVNADFALRFGLFFIAIVMFFSIFLGRNIIHACEKENSN